MTTANTESTASKLPSHQAFHVRKTAKGEAIWTQIGAAWPHADGKGFSIQVDIVPLDGKIALRIPSEKSVQ